MWYNGIMQIIEKMNDDSFDQICDAGAEMVAELVKIMDKHGIPLEQASNIMAVAAAGVTVGGGLELDKFSVAVELSVPMWRAEVRNGVQGIVFDPPHRRPDFVGVKRDATKEN